MSWWRLTLRYGPGRQSGHVQYDWRERTTPQALEDWRSDLHDEFDDYEYGPAVITIERVRALPATEHQRLMRRYQDAIERSRTMLMILAKTPVVKTKNRRRRP